MDSERNFLCPVHFQLRVAHPWLSTRVRVNGKSPGPSHESRIQSRRTAVKRLKDVLDVFPLLMPIPRSSTVTVISLAIPFLYAPMPVRASTGCCLIFDGVGDQVLQALSQCSKVSTDRRQAGFQSALHGKPAALTIPDVLSQNSVNHFQGRRGGPHNGAWTAAWRQRAALVPPDA